VKRLIFILTGRPGSGKTTLCQHLAEAVRGSGSSVQGLVSPAHYENGRKQWITAQDLHSGETRPLARREGKGLFLPELAPWHFDEGTLVWGNGVLDQAAPCDWLVIDELGPLEFTFGLGWQMAFKVLAGKLFRQALVVVREELLDQAQQRWPGAIVIRSQDPGVLARLLQGAVLPHVKKYLK
jgi:nucleoside-triphosphatase THEP1